MRKAVFMRNAVFIHNAVIIHTPHSFHAQRSNQVQCSILVAVGDITEVFFFVSMVSIGVCHTPFVKNGLVRRFTRKLPHLQPRQQ
jgi:hypothetical protein